MRFLGLVDGFVPGFDDERTEALPEPLALPSTPAAFSARERAAGQLTLAHLSELSRTFELPRLSIAPHCWWSSEGRALRAAVVQTLTLGVGHAPRSSEEIATSHEEIVRHPAFLRSLSLQLEAVERAETEEESYVR